MSRSALSRRLNRFHAWYRLARSWVLLQQVVLFVGCSLLLLCLVDRLVFVRLDWGFALLCAGTAGVGAMLVGFLLFSRQTGWLSYLIDRNADLKNLIASALEVENRQDELARLVVQRAEIALERHQPRVLIPLSLTRSGRWAPVPYVLLGLGVAFLPNIDLLQRRAQALTVQKEQEKRLQSAQAITQTLQKLETVNRNITSIEGKNITNDLQNLANELGKVPDRKEALSKLSALENQYKEEFAQQRSFENATRNLSTRLDAHDLASASRDALKDLADSLRNNEFSKSADAMRKLAEQMNNPDLSEEQRQALARELGKMMSEFQGQQQADNLSKTLKDMSSSAANGQNSQKPNQNPGQKTPNSGQQNPQQQQQQAATPSNPNQMNKNQPGQQNQQQAQNPAQQQNPTQNNGEKGQCSKPGNSSKPGENGNPQAGQQGQQSLSQDQQQQAADQMNEMADALQQMDSLKEMQEGLNQARREMVGDQFKDFNPQDIDKYLSNENSDKSCQGGQCPGGQGQGGIGGKGKGQGGVAPEAQTPTAFDDKLARSNSGQGRILNQMWVYGVPEKGEARNEYSSEVRNAEEKAMSSLARNPVPREYEHMVKEYFSSLEPKQE